MSLASFSCYLWWFVLGGLAGWLALWLIDRLFLRDGSSAQRLASMEEQLSGSLSQQNMQASDIVSLRSELVSTSRNASDTANQLRQRITEQESREKAYEAEFGRLKGELDQRTQSLTAGGAEIGKLKSDLSSAAAALAASRNEAGTSQSAHAEAQGELARVRSEFQRQAERMTLLERDLDAARQSIIDAKRAGGNLDAAQEEAQAQEITHLRKELETARTSGAGLAQEIERLKAGSSGDAARITQLSNEIEAVRLAGSRQAEELQLARTSLADVEARAGKTSSDSATLLRQAETEMLSLKASLGEATQRADKYDAEVARLMSELSQQSTLAGELARLKAEVADKTSAIAELSGLKGQLATAHGHSEQLMRELADARNLASTSGTELESLRARVTSLTAQISQFDALRNAMESARKAAAGHAAEIARLNEQLLGNIGSIVSNDPSGNKS